MSVASLGKNSVRINIFQEETRSFFTVCSQESAVLIEVIFSSGALIGKYRVPRKLTQLQEKTVPCRALFFIPRSLKKNFRKLEETVEAGVAAFQKGDLENSRKIFYKANALLNPSGLNHYLEALVWNNLGMVYGSTNQYSLALPYCQASVRILKRNWGEQNQVIGWCRQRIGEFLRLSNEQESPRYWRRTIAIQKQCIGIRRSDVVHSLHGLARALLQVGGREQKVFSLLVRAFKISCTLSEAETISCLDPILFILNELASEKFAKEKREELLSFAKKRLKEEHLAVQKLRKVGEKQGNSYKRNTLLLSTVVLLLGVLCFWMQRE